MIINLNTYVYADDEIEEVDVTLEEMGEILEAATGIEKVPTINSRYAIIYDRTSRRSFVWETRKYEM